uniref:Right handed beta helix domain-containing protein n=1 Tax=Rhodosorus marinus TaxID=101924 RepID=A0A7S0G4Z6_9RHOD|mmetsp:Transcript_3290/g.4725  ORF Transcript_3290/g.4725 Transcript_3290/m.4725 type:complete len:428 (+) Transcript_3290:2-1285(+)
MRKGERKLWSRSHFSIGLGGNALAWADFRTSQAIDMKFGNVAFVATCWVLLLVSWSDAGIINLKCQEGLAKQINDAPPFSTLIADKRCLWRINFSVLIRKSMTLSGVRLKLVSEVPRTLLKIEAPGVRLHDFVLIGNSGFADAKATRMPLLHIVAGNFYVQNGQFYNSTKDGVLVSGERAEIINGPIIGGVIKDIVGRGLDRDLVSLTTSSAGKVNTKNIVVDNVRMYSSGQRGAVEISNGVEDIFVRNVYAENCFYAVAIQDHGLGYLQMNKRVLISNVIAIHSDFAVLSQVVGVRHGEVSISRVIAKQCRKALILKNLDWVRVEDVRVIGSQDSGPIVSIYNCANLKLRDISIGGGKPTISAISVTFPRRVRIEGITLGKHSKAQYGLDLRLRPKSATNSLKISHVDLAAARIRRIRVQRVSTIP